MNLFGWWQATPIYWITSATKNIGLLSFAAQVDLFAKMSAFGDFYTAGETPRAPRAPSSALICDFVLMQCLLKHHLTTDAHR